MGVKTLVFLGLLTSAVFAYFCINSKKDTFYATINQNTQQVAEVKSQPQLEVKPQPIIKKKPSFAFVAGVKSKIAALLSKDDKNGKIIKMINDVCGENGCVKDIKYFDDIKKFTFTSEILNLINHSIEKNIDAFALYIDKNIVRVDGILKNDEDKIIIDEQLQHFKDKGYDVENNAHVKLKISEKPKPKHIQAKKSEIKPAKEVIVNKSTILQKTIKKQGVVKEPVKEVKKIEKLEPVKSLEPVKKIEKVKEIKKPVSVISPKPIKKITKAKKHIPVQEVIINEAIIAPKDVFVVPEHVSLEEASYRISDLLIAEPINFELDKSIIMPESKNTLDKISDILLEQDNIKVEVAGYTDASGEETYNKVLSQKRADAVRKYLIKSGVRSKIIRSVGYGSKDLISDDPLDTINRRVEIHIKEGK